MSNSHTPLECSVIRATLHLLKLLSIGKLNQLRIFINHSQKCSFEWWVTAQEYSHSFLPFSTRKMENALSFYGAFCRVYVFYSIKCLLWSDPLLREAHEIHSNLPSVYLHWLFTGNVLDKTLLVPWEVGGLICPNDKVNLMNKCHKHMSTETYFGRGITYTT